jgi:OOP family OmpA-OmpF porin
MTRLFPVLLVLSFLSLLPQSLRAESEVYGGFGIGYSTFSIDEIDFEAASFATRQFLGFRYGDYVGLEAGFIDFGTVDDRIGVQQGLASLDYEVESSGFNLSLIGRYPLNDELAAFGKLGMIRWDSEVTLEDFPLSEKEDGTDLIWGLGLDFRGSGRFHIRVEAEFVDIEFADSWWVLTTSLIYGVPFAR